MKQDNNKLNKAVCLAIIGAAHGVRGDVYIKALGNRPQQLGDYGTFYDETGYPYEIEAFSIQKKGVVIRFKGIKSRDDAEKLKGTHLYIERDKFANDLEKDEFYQVDLIGLRVYDEAGQILGEVSGFFNFGAGDLLEVHLGPCKKELIPFSKAAVPEISLSSGFLIVDRIAAGLSSD
ncbi:ribosome maturation factor RimM [Bartonella ancashensis]|uniref:Ribosome maturation factor RimM n=1 Tax=Bartonella ancashensis TaxID=1318743 RepID=A0A0M4M2Q2_9HYPH|nr:ribosome maturation factor RimM [Bartonella ancashensis]ALE03187.1 16S rRNA processing protein RimM [Bartonella ancashensis]